MKQQLILFFAAVGMLFTSCSSDYEILPSAESIILTADSSTRIIGNDIVFTVTNNEGLDLTQEAVFHVNGTEIEGNVFNSSETGNFEVKATYAGVDSESITVNFHDGSEINFTKRLLIEDYTGTWCGYCPRVAHAIDLVKAQTDNIVTVAIHRESLNPNSPSYDPYTYDSSELEDVINIPGYPKGLLNRMTQWSFPEPNNINQAIALTQGENPKLGLAMASSVSGNTISLDVNVQFSKNFSGLKLVVYVLENGLIHDQHNYTSYYGGASILPDFEHNHTLRSCATNLLGDAISSSETTTGNIYSRSFTIPVPATVENASNLEFVAFVVDTDGNAINVRAALPGDTQDFEFL